MKSPKILTQAQILELDVHQLQLALYECMSVIKQANSMVKEAQEIQGRCNKLTDLVIDNIENIKYSRDY